MGTRLSRPKLVSMTADTTIDIPADADVALALPYGSGGAVVFEYDDTNPNVKRLFRIFLSDVPIADGYIQVAAYSQTGNAYVVYERV